MKDKIKQVALDAGITAAGVSSVDRLGSQPSMDPEYIMPEARSIISLMEPFNTSFIKPYLAKEDHAGMQAHETAVYRKLYSAGQKVVEFLKSEGHEAVVVEPNLDYRFKYGRAWKGMDPKNYWGLTPSFSHRYGAVAAGLAHFGWSSNVMHPDYGAQVLFDTVFTTAELESDPMMENTPCSGCKICTRVCQTGMMDSVEEDHVMIGGRKFTHVRKAHNLRCIFCCSGMIGQSKYEKWSTWSPGRFEVPEKDEDLQKTWEKLMKENVGKKTYFAKIFMDLMFHTQYGFIRKPEDRFNMTCGNCQLVCGKTDAERKENYKIIINSGVVEEGPDFSFKVVKKTEVA